VLVPASTPPDPYENSQSVAYRIAMGSQSGNVYIHADGSSDYFSAFKGDFSPAITQSDIDNSNTLSFVARTDYSTLNPPLNASDGSTVNDAHKIVKLVFYDKNGNVQKTFTTAEYTSYLASRNQSTYTTTTTFQNEWPIGIALIIAGLLWCASTTLVLLLRRRAKKRQLSIAGIYPSPYGGAFPQTYANQQPYYPQSPYDHLSGPSTPPPPPPPPYY